MKKKDLQTRYHDGWSEKSEKRIEFYNTILNDLAEGTITSRINLGNVVEALGYMTKKHDGVFTEMSLRLTELGVKALQLSRYPEKEAKAI